MKKTNIDPWPWGLDYGISQGILVEGGQKVLYCAGQSAIDHNGIPQFAGDMEGQLRLALDNVETVLKAAGLELSALVRLNIYTTDLDAFFAAHSALTDRLSAANAAPPGTLLEVKRLGSPDVMVELEATAAA